MSEKQKVAIYAAWSYNRVTKPEMEKWNAQFKLTSGFLPESMSIRVGNAADVVLGPGAMVKVDQFQRITTFVHQGACHVIGET